MDVVYTICLIWKTWSHNWDISTQLYISAKLFLTLVSALTSFEILGSDTKQTSQLTKDINSKVLQV